MVILVYRAREAQPLAQYAVGDVAPDAISRYVDAVGGAGVVTIPGLSGGQPRGARRRTEGRAVTRVTHARPPRSCSS
jgi:hypothetical protein